MTIDVHGSVLTIDGCAVQLEWPVLEVAETQDKVFVLLDPDAYLADAGYKSSLRNGGPAIRNLVGVSRDGRRLWEAEFPEARDYYYQFSSIAPLRVNSFSSFLCEIDPETGKILTKEFLK
jgi:hypothetical protein